MPYHFNPWETNFNPWQLGAALFGAAVFALGLAGVVIHAIKAWRSVDR